MKRKFLQSQKQEEEWLPLIKVVVRSELSLLGMQSGAPDVMIHGMPGGALLSGVSETRKFLLPRVQSTFVPVTALRVLCVAWWDLWCHTSFNLVLISDRQMKF